jgi:glycosyltransferase involved in cell wall biosynthesis
MSDSCLVSVLITAYNREKFIAESITSVLNQTYQNFELIIVDDCSSDNTFEIIKSFTKIDSRIRYYRNDKNIGQFPNRNLTFSYAVGDYIVFLDSDDTFNSDALEYIVNSFNANPLSQHSSIYFGGFSAPFLMKSDDAIRKHFFGQNILSCGPSARVFTKDFYISMSGYPERYGPAGDLFFNIKTTSTADILFLPYNYLNYRIHNGQELNNQFSYIYNGYKYFNDALTLSEIPLLENEISFLAKKNKRRFIVNSFKFLLKTKNVNQFKSIYKLANFKFNDFIVGIFHL